ncbi:MAG TPA: hypothetical protein VMU57_12005 [Edaphobacter sp.]|uniref:hypothetical protein n=1 Tax=Edaphobacter sp. TaxID=1934404 RepID=UPI002C19776F|nr:hypothetical protein [Edaphobacter sp.]HUZ95629.1 hypothetical protein [Edaphobacter sp.]
MSQNRCECEREVVQALRTGVWTAELQDHVAACVACGEIRRVAGSLLQYASGLRVEGAAGDVDAIWRRARAERQAMALKRATRPLIFMRGLSVGCVVVFASWMLPGFSRLDHRVWMHGWAGAGVETAAVGVGIAVACIGVGAVYMLREDRRRGVLSGAS